MRANVLADIKLLRFARQIPTGFGADAHQRFSRFRAYLFVFRKGQTENLVREIVGEGDGIAADSFTPSFAASAP